MSSKKLIGVPFMVPASADGTAHYTLLFVNVADLESLEFVEKQLETYLKQHLKDEEHDGKYYISYTATEKWGRNSVKLLGDSIGQFHRKLFEEIELRLVDLIGQGRIKLGAYREPHVDVKGQFDKVLLKRFNVFEWMDLDRAKRRLK